MIKNYTIITFLILLFLGISCTSNKVFPFQDAIDKFQIEDKQISTKTEVILFVGSSSFTNWKAVNQDLGCNKIVNRGFGGSTLTDLWNHRKVLFTTYKPKQIFIYCGENDLAQNESIGSQDVLGRWQKLHRYIQKKNSTVPIYFVSLKPSPSRWRLKNKMMEANEAIKVYNDQQKLTYFIDIWANMLNIEGRPKSEIFTKDSLHMNNLGYDIWVDKLVPIIQCK